MIKFNIEEDYCRWNGILMTPEKCLELFGIDGEIEKAAEDVWYYDGWIYSDKPFGETLKLFGFKASKEEQERFSFKPNALIFSGTFFDDTKGIKPIENFFIDYPDFDILKYNEFWNELNEYYRARFPDIIDF